MIKIAIINQSTVVSDADLASYVHALQMQVTRDFAPIWGVYAELVFVPKGRTPDPSMWWLTVLDDSDVAGALGYHDLTPAGLPCGKVFARTDLTYGNKVSVTISHELLEMLADPWIFSTVVAQSFPGVDGPVLLSLEVCDACEADSLGYDINGITVSDFIFPAWFDGVGSQYDFGKHITQPLQILAEGYMAVMPFNTPGNWTQITAQGIPHRVGNAAPVGSRRERRKIGKECWKKSDIKSF